jgi:hypothetical protein
VSSELHIRDGKPVAGFEHPKGFSEPIYSLSRQHIAANQAFFRLEKDPGESAFSLGKLASLLC